MTTPIKKLTPEELARYASSSGGNAFGELTPLLNHIAALEAENGELKRKNLYYEQTFTHKANLNTVELERDQLRTTIEDFANRELHTNEMIIELRAQVAGIQNARSVTYGELPELLQKRIESHIWDNMNFCEQRDWCINQLASVTPNKTVLEWIAPVMEQCYLLLQRITLWKTGVAEGVEVLAKANDLAEQLSRLTSIKAKLEKGTK